MQFFFQFVEQAVGQSDRDLSVIRELVGRIGLAALLKSLAYERHDDYAHEVMVTTAYIIYLLSEIILFDILAHIAHIYTEKDEAKEYGADNFTISRGMVNTMGEIRGVESWVNFTETEDGVLCELRSSLHNINPIAKKYGGGGHAKASGATLKNRDEAMAMLEDLKALGGDN